MPTLVPTPPTSFLPPLARLTSQSTEQIRTALQGLKSLYWPPPPPPLPLKLSVPKRATRRRIHDDSVPDSGYASAEEEDADDDLVEETLIQTPPYNLDQAGDNYDERMDPEVLRSDPLERAFVLKWITGFAGRSDTWITAASDDDDSEDRANLLDQATSLLSAFLGNDDETEGDVTRSFSFPTADGGVVDVQLNDAALSSEDHTSVGLQSWASSIHLAERMSLTPAYFSLCAKEAGPLRVLELGAGTGLLSIVAAKILQDAPSAIVATDYHPDVLSNLKVNIDSNLSGARRSSSVSVHALDWESPDYSPAFDESFDIILAADVVYHPEHSRWIRGCVERLLARPQSGNANGKDGGVFWLMIALRMTGRHEGMDHTVDSVFPDISAFTTSTGSCDDTWTLAVMERSDVGRYEGVGRADEGGYRLFKIGWVDSRNRCT